MKQLLILTLAGALTLAAQTTPPASTKSVQIAWKDSNGAGVSWRIERAPVACTATNPVFTQIGTSTTLTYLDAAVAPGQYCYRIIAFKDALVSPPSAPAGATVPLSAPTDLSITVTVAVSVDVNGKQVLAKQFEAVTVPKSANDPPAGAVTVLGGLKPSAVIALSPDKRPCFRADANGNWVEMPCPKAE